jgi:chorismate mutase
MPLLWSLEEGRGALAAIDMALLRSFSNRFMVTMHVRSTKRLSMNRRTNMPLLRSLEEGRGSAAAIDMALLRSFSNRFMVTMRVSKTWRLPMNGTPLPGPLPIGDGIGAGGWEREIFSAVREVE